MKKECFLHTAEFISDRDDIESLWIYTKHGGSFVVSWYEFGEQYKALQEVDFEELWFAIDNGYALVCIDDISHIICIKGE